jgi:hypothetical protein
LITLGIIENLRKIKASRVVLLPSAPDYPLTLCHG